ncbi:MAG: RagB/SusD family nutrient uptake outer membrane protein [Chitinophagaceae bacterium]|jgi:hypothetical protein|nr:MAG: RagB/SusD family nutrient uptake outer membrane protein [Chitinophagaceae bacterium]
MRRSKFLFISVLMCSLAFSGCKKILDIHSTHAVDEANFWNSHDDTRAALIGAYGLMRAALANDDAWWMYGDLREGDFTSLSRIDIQSIIDGKLNTPYPLLNDLSDWRRFYAVINACNMFLEHVGEVKARDSKYSEQNMQVDIAQIRTLRAFAYFLMVRIWGDVPLITESHDGEFKPKGRDSQQKVLAFCEQELLAAVKYLPYLYSSDDPLQQGQYYNEDAGTWNGALVRKLSAYSILAHVEAWQGKYADVAAYTKFILDNYSQGGHSFLAIDQLTNSNGFFSGRQYNHILAFDFLWNNTDASNSGHLEDLTLAQPLINKQSPDIYVSKDSILSIFNLPNDERFSLDTLTGQPTSENYFTNFNSSIPIFSKIKVIRDGNSTDPSLRIYGSAIIFTRLEEIVLLRAEALAIIGDRNGAITLLNQVRDERDVAHYNQADDGDLITAIFRERRKELMGEGWRWYDLIRYNKIKQNNPAFMQLIRSGGIYWPVSDDIIAQNKLITQNPYWR